VMASCITLLRASTLILVHRAPRVLILERLCRHRLRRRVDRGRCLVA
jgi:hypothetical protein